MMNPFDTRSALQILLFYMIIDTAILPIMLTLGPAMVPTYRMIFFAEGVLAIIIGSLKLIDTADYTIEKAEDEYVGMGQARREVREVELTVEERRQAQVKGLTLVITGLLFVFVWEIIFRFLLF